MKYIYIHLYTQPMPKVSLLFPLAPTYFHNASFASKINPTSLRL